MIESTDGDEIDSGGRIVPVWETRRSHRKTIGKFGGIVDGHKTFYSFFSPVLVVSFSWMSRGTGVIDKSYFLDLGLGVNSTTNAGR